MSEKKEKTTEEFLREIKDKENVERETDFQTNIQTSERLLAEAKKTQSSSEGYSLRAIGWALVQIARELHELNQNLPKGE